MKQDTGVVPGLAVVLVGNRPDSATYVRMKKKAAAEVELHAVDVSLPDTVRINIHTHSNLQYSQHFNLNI